MTTKHNGHQIARAQESWQEFKDKSNTAAESVLREVTHPHALRTKVKKLNRRMKTAWNDYGGWIIGGAVALAIAVVAKAVMCTNNSADNQPSNV